MVMAEAAPRTMRGLPGATVLQIIPALEESPQARGAVDLAVALLRSGARVLVASEDGPLNSELQGLGGEWVRLVRGDGLSARSRAETTKRQLHITTAHQFPLFLPDLPARKQRKDLYAGLGVIVFDGAQGHGFYKGGHDGQTANTMVCIESRQRCVIILSNDVRAEAGFSDLVKVMLGETGVPYDWEYADRAGKS